MYKTHTHPTPNSPFRVSPMAERMTRTPAATTSAGLEADAAVRSINSWPNVATIRGKTASRNPLLPQSPMLICKPFRSVWWKSSFLNSSSVCYETFFSQHPLQSRRRQDVRLRRARSAVRFSHSFPEKKKEKGGGISSSRTCKTHSLRGISNDTYLTNYVPK